MTSTKRFDFKNSEGQTLSGRLEFPDGSSRAYALFAHCFTCTKDFIAAARISKRLSELGIAVLRFDFTGLGDSEGEFENTDFSSNVQDLISACYAMDKVSMTPEILIGHSLGGSAVLKASLKLPEIKAVVTIAAPSDVSHITNLFCEDLKEINSKGHAQVDLSGRVFTIKKEFVEDIEEEEFLRELSHSDKAHLIMHSPLDNIVSIDHAQKIFNVLKHPKSFISLDDADHLLLEARDAEYAATIIEAWAERYLGKNGNL